MNLKKKKEQLTAIYERFEAESREFWKQAVCRPGCAFCCTNMGNIDVITLEGMIIREHIRDFSSKKKKEMCTRLLRNREEKVKGRTSPCPFLKADQTCLIYEIRPFSCRQLYSLGKCGPAGATVHRQARELAGKTVKNLQQLDDNGYSGHISFILHLLDNREFREFYQSGGFDPARIREFGKSGGLLINRMVSAAPVASG
ncbi:MAG: YkgJ family cysteine cluster protein [Desulfobacterales bacterium]